MSLSELRTSAFYLARRALGYAAVLSLLATLSATPLSAAEIAWRKDADEALDASARENKPLLVMVTAEWCGYCHKMLRHTFPNPKVAARVNDEYVPILLDADEYPELIQKLKIGAMPTVLIVAPDRKIIRRISGFKTAAQFDATLSSLTDAIQKGTGHVDHPSGPTVEENKKQTAGPATRQRRRTLSTFTR